MREHLYRGKRIDNGEWVHGDLQTPKIKYFNADSYFITTEEGITYRVAPDTLGQFTGLPDKNGTRIFEGDIVEFYTNLNIHGGNIIEPEETIKSIWKNVERRENAFVGGYRYVRKDQAIVQWNSKDGLWDLKVYNNGRYKRKSKLFTFRSEGNYEVIGNKWDNPELLEVAHG